MCKKTSQLEHRAELVPCKELEHPEKVHPCLDAYLNHVQRVEPSLGEGDRAP